MHQHQGKSETYCGFDNVLGADRRPGNGGGVTLGEDLDSLAVDYEVTTLGLDRTIEAAVDGVVLEHVDLRTRR